MCFLQKFSKGSGLVIGTMVDANFSVVLLLNSIVSEQVVSLDLIGIKRYWSLRTLAAGGLRCT